MTTETAGEDENFGTEASQRVIIRMLGMERRDRVLAGLYMGRSDVALMVRQAALHVWKVVVTNTPKTLREILPTLFNLLLGHLASDSYDKRQVRVVEITYNVILDQDQVLAIHFDLRSDLGQIIFVTFYL